MLQHGAVGPLEQPLLAGRRRVAGAHEDAALGGAAVHAAVADWVVDALILMVEGTGSDTIHTLTENVFF